MAFLAFQPPHDKLIGPVVSFHGREALSQMFHFQVEVELRKNQRTAANLQTGLLGTEVGFTVQRGHDTQTFHGLIQRVSHLADDSILRIDLVPWLWKLTLASDCRIFHNQTVPDIISELFSDFGYTKGHHFVMPFKADSYPKMEYAVQYRETACNFVLRLLEQEGIFFFFRHQTDGHVLVFGDSRDGYDEAPGSVPLRGTNAVTAAESVIETLESDHQLGSVEYRLKSHNFQKPKAKLEPFHKAPAGAADIDKCVLFDYSCEFDDHKEGERYAELRMQEEECGRRTFRGASNVLGFRPGQVFTLKGTPANSFLLTSITHAAQAAQGDEADIYSNSFTCIPGKMTFRPARLTPKPIIQGVQTAFVIPKQTSGKKDKEAKQDKDVNIAVDDLGRVRVRFHWDRKKQGSCFLRAAQAWAGNGWGSFWPLRVGQEVLVEFLEGDPDRPIIIGTVYGPASSLSHHPPETQAASLAVRTRTTPNKNSNGFNEVGIDDSMDKERIYLKAQRNLEITVGNDCIEKVDGDRHTTIAGDQQIKITKDHLLESEKGAVYLRAGTKLVLEAGSQLSLVGPGDNFIDISAAGIVITGTIVKINCKGAKSATGKRPEPKTPKKVDPNA